MDRVSVSSLNGPLSVDSPQTMTVMRRGDRSLRRRSLCSTARALAALAISLRQMLRPSRSGPSIGRTRGPLWKTSCLWKTDCPACPVDHANNAARCCSRLRTQWSAGLIQSARTKWLWYGEPVRSPEPLSHSNRSSLSRLMKCSTACSALIASASLAFSLAMNASRAGSE